MNTEEVARLSFELHSSCLTRLALCQCSPFKYYLHRPVCVVNHVGSVPLMPKVVNLCSSFLFGTVSTPLEKSRLTHVHVQSTWIDLSFVLSRSSNVTIRYPPLKPWLRSVSFLLLSMWFVRCLTAYDVNISLFGFPHSRPLSFIKTVLWHHLLFFL